MIATTVYFITIEDTVSLWDCGEYITAAYKLEVGHPPGAPLFMVLGRLFSFFADPHDVAVYINMLSALSSSLTILFMFWSITLLAKKISLRNKGEVSAGDKVAIFGSALIGSLAYTFSESFWFSAVEGEVYAMASLFTAAIFWAILKWDEEMMEIQNGQLVVGYSPDRWLILIMFLLGLAIGVHLLGILVVPAIGYIIYFRYNSIGKQFYFIYLGLGVIGTIMTIIGTGASALSFFGIILGLGIGVGLSYLIYLWSQKNKIVEFLLVGLMTIAILGFIQERIIPGSVSVASAFEVTFVNSIGLPFFSGSIFFFILLIFGCIFGLRYARKKGNRTLYSSFMGLIVLLIGYGSFAVIVIRSNANTPLDENNPENLVTLHSYLKREQYGSAPLLFGPHWNSKENTQDKYDIPSAFYLRRFVVIVDGEETKAFMDENRANDFAKSMPGAEVVEKYFESNASLRDREAMGGGGSIPTYAQKTFFPRMYWNNDQQHINGYIAWSGYDANDKSAGTDLGKDGKRLPTFGENMQYFADYQLNWMYWRYFMWNFAGRQNDIQGHGDQMRGNWISGFSSIDDMRLGSQKDAPFFTAENKSNNKFFFLPLILGVIGLFFHFYRTPKDAFVVLLAFLFTGIMIVVYLNQKPFEPRERDYAFAGSFYFFAMWIGLGVYALYDAYLSFKKKELIHLGIGIGAMLLFFWINGASSALSWLLISGIIAALVGLMVVLRKVLKKESHGALFATLISLAVPVIMGMQGWDDHDRSLKTSARDLALNYLNSCEKNGIIFTNGDNDTFPLWYAQEVEGERTDVRVCNLSLMQTDWYTDQMKMRAYESDPLPIKFTEDQILMYAGNTDQVNFVSLLDLFFINAKSEVIKKIIDMRVKNNAVQAEQSMNTFSNKSLAALSTANSSDARGTQFLDKVKGVLADSSKADLTNSIYKKFQATFEVFKALNSGMITAEHAALNSLQESMMSLETNWDFTDLSEAMEFVRNDDNMVSNEGRLLRIFPSTGFTLKVNTENAIKSGVITEAQKKSCHDEIKFKFELRGLTREEVMMLDVIANNDWKRGIYFSSPYGSKVSTSLLMGADQFSGGYIKQNGMAFELNPVKDNDGGLNHEKMYTNLMEKYIYGAMNNPDVLTDYYTRRHTTQFRNNFYRLADFYIRKAERAEMEWKMYNDATARGVITQQKPSISKEEIAKFRKRSIALIKKSLEVMPAETVIDYGEPNPDNRETYKIPGGEFPSYKDGILHDYIEVLLKAGDKKTAGQLGEVVTKQLESIIDYYEKADPGVAIERGNTEDLYAALHSYLLIQTYLNDPQFGIANDKLTNHVNDKVDYYFNKMIPSVLNKLRDKANENGESVRRGSGAGVYASMLFEFEDYTMAMGVYFGVIKPEQSPSVPSQEDEMPALEGVLPELMELQGDSN